MRSRAVVPSFLLVLSGACTTAPDAASVDAGADTGASTVDAFVAADGTVDGGESCDVAPVTITHTADAVTDTIHAHLLDTTVHPNAVCNDGTPGYFYFRRGVGGGAHRWIVYLEGGGSCESSTDCVTRFHDTPGYMTSSTVHEGDGLPVAVEGIKEANATTNPDFYDANYVQLAYCSSDAWSGDTAATPGRPTSDIAHWSFRGRAIIDAVLTKVRTLGLSDGDEVLLVGSSAGGVGVFVSADRIHEALGPNIRMLALPDAGFMIDYPAYDTTTMTESTAVPTARAADLAMAAGFWGGHGDESCEAAATDPTSRLLCRSPYALGIGNDLTTRFFIRQSQRDGVQIKAFIDGPTGTDAQHYKQRWAAHMVDELTMVSARHGVYSTNDTQHGVINDDSVWTTSSIGTVTLPGAIGAWYRDPCTNAEHRIGS